MDSKKLEKHVKLCRRNLRSSRVKCCATCPFEEEITTQYPDMKQSFCDKRKAVRGGSSVRESA